MLHSGHREADRISRIETADIHWGKDLCRKAVNRQRRQGAFGLHCVRSAGLADLRDGKRERQRLIQFLSFEMPGQDVMSPQLNISGRRPAVPCWINVSKQSPIGDIVLDGVPSQSIKRLKTGLSVRQPSTDLASSLFSRRVLVERFSPRCAELDEQYCLVRERFIEDMSIPGNDQDSASCSSGLSYQEYSMAHCEPAGG
jgi:hypothetical protein